MTETMTAETTEVVNAVETPKQGALKKFAKAFAAKVRKTAQAVKAFFVRTLGDNEPTIREDEGLGRKFARVILAVPKWLAHIPRVIIGAVGYVITTVVFLAATLVAVVVFLAAALISLVVLVAVKLVSGIALVIRTPYLLVVSIDAFKCDWSGYLLGWTPRYFMTTRIQQVHYLRAQRAALAEEEANLAATDAILEAVTEWADEKSMADVVTPAVHTETALTVHQGGKGHPTPKQHKRRPARVPATAVAGAEA